MSTGSINLMALGLMTAGLTGAGLISNQISASSGRNQLVYTDRAEDGMTREEALGVAAGAFRGIVVNYLWIRANELKQAGKFYEAVDLAKTITRLQPRFPRVWAFHAWNLAYNISVQTQTQEERWQWVNAGIRLLRDEAIPKNPSDMFLHKELAWTLLHKVQGMMDDANGHYKRQFAREWTTVVGAPPRRKPSENTSKAYADSMIRWLDRIATAPDTLADVVETDKKMHAAFQADPTAQPHREPAAEKLIAALTSAGYDLGKAKDRMRLLEMIELQNSAIIRSRAVQAAGQLRGLDNRVMDSLTDAVYTDAWNLLSRHLRKRVVADAYHMDVERMKRYTEKYGPMDWRHPAAHAVYWSAKGVEAALDRTNKNNIQNQDFLNTDRITVQSVQELYRSGTIMYDMLSPQSFFAMPSIDFIDPYGEIIEENQRREEEQFMAKFGTDTSQRTWTLLRGGYENFLHDAISYLYRSGHIDAAKRYQLKLASWKGRVENDIDAQRIRTLPLEDFVVWNLQERVTSPNIAIQEIQGALFAAYTRGLLTGDSETFRRHFEYARAFHKAFTDEQSRKTPSGKDSERMLAQINKDFNLAAAEYFLAALDRLPETDQAILYRNAPNDLQIIAYDVIENMYSPRDADGKPQDSKINKVIFPEPEGLIAYRAVQRLRAKPAVEEGKLQAK